MARYTGAVCKLCRREGMKLFLKGDKCYGEKCCVQLRSYAPGQHGQNRKKRSEYDLQLREKQKTKRYYGVLESQFKKYFNIAEKMPGVTGENLLSLIERRFDNVVYRMGFGMSRAEARQLVLHGHFTLNGKKANIPSMILKEGDVVAVKAGSRDSEKIKFIAEVNASHPVPKWLDVNKATLEGRIITNPQRDDIDLAIEEHLIVELYSK